MVKRTLLEFVLVVVVGLAVGLTANAVYDDGLVITRDYFHSKARSQPIQPTTDPADVTAPSTAPVEDDPVAARLREIGLQAISHEDVVALFEDPGYEANAYLFIDARDDEHYTEGHIPGALQFNHYRPERHIDEVLPYCQGAEKVVVYCGGGKCEDSEHVALDLRDEHFIDPAILFVYTGGIKAWKNNGMPIERGERFSDDIIECAP